MVTMIIACSSVAFSRIVPKTDTKAQWSDWQECISQEVETALHNSTSKEVNFKDFKVVGANDDYSYASGKVYVVDLKDKNSESVIRVTVKGIIIPLSYGLNPVSLKTEPQLYCHIDMGSNDDVLVLDAFDRENHSHSYLKIYGRISRGMEKTQKDSNMAKIQ